MINVIQLVLVFALSTTPVLLPVEDTVMDWENVWPTTFEVLVPEERPITEKPRAAPIVRVTTRPANIVAPEDLRVLVEQYFEPEDVDLALLVSWCESRWDASAKNPKSTASGLFQHLEGWWSGRWGVTGVFDPFNPEESVRAAAQLAYGTKSGWGNWNPSKYCWG